jgi:peptidoglycan/LPS O-acetylase OafA/YrhL
MAPHPDFQHAGTRIASPEDLARHRDRDVSPPQLEASPATAHDTYLGVQGLRFIAALMVVISHSMTMIVDRHLSAAMPRWTGGHAGVDVFFVISGFVMSFSLIPLQGRADGWRVFFSRRLVRIVPLYWIAMSLKVVLVMALPSMAGNAHVSVQHLISSYFFLPGIAPDGNSVPFMPVGWTLNFEMFFYLLCTISLLLAVSPMGFVAVVLAGLALLGMASPSHVPSEASYSNPIVLEFLLGMLAGHAVRGQRPSGSFVPLGLAASGFMALFLAPSDPGMMRPLVWGIPSALLVYGTASSEARLRRWLPKFVIYLGDSSYALYLFHTFVVPAVIVLCLRWSAGNPWRIPVLCVMVSVALSAAIHQWLERPLTSWLKQRIFRGKSAGNPS